MWVGGIKQGDCSSLEEDTGRRFVGALCHMFYVIISTGKGD